MEFPLTIRRTTGLSGSFGWLSSGVQGVVSVNPLFFTATATFRQLPSDTPLLTISTTPSTLGSILYLPAVTNYPYLPPELFGEAPAVSPITLTLFPIAISITAAGAAAIPYAYCYWELDLKSVVDGSGYPLIDRSLVTMVQT